MTECRRCGECQGQDHHWVEDLVFSNDDFGAVIGEYACKHCPVVGIECGACDGVGTTGCDELGAEGELEPSQDCPICGGEGIKVVEGFTADEEADA
jgi:hypothetical protein